MPPRPPSTSPALPARPPTAPAAPPSAPSTWPAMGAGRRSFRKPTVVSTAMRACDSLMPVFSTTCLISSSTDHPPLVRLMTGRPPESDRPAPSTSDEDDGLEVRDVEASAASRAGEHVVHAHHVVARLGELRLLLLVHAARGRLFLRANHPAHLEVAALAAVRATVVRALRLLSLVEEISLVHKFGG